MAFSTPSPLMIPISCGRLKAPCRRRPFWMNQATSNEFPPAIVSPPHLATRPLPDYTSLTKLAPPGPPRMAAGPGSPDHHLGRARRALAEGDHAAAAEALAQLVAADPNQPETLKLLDEFVASTLDPTVFVPIDLPEPPFHGLVALHAYCLAGIDRLPEAIDVLTQAVVANPEVAYIEWLIKWLDKPEAEKMLPIGRLAWFVHLIAEQFGALQNPRGGGRG